MRAIGIGITIFAGAQLTSVGFFFTKQSQTFGARDEEKLIVLGITITIIGLFLLIKECFKKKYKLTFPIKKGTTPCT